MPLSLTLTLAPTLAPAQLNFLVSAFVIQWYLICGGFFHQAFTTSPGSPMHKIEISLSSLLLADFASAAVLITFGALLGKVRWTPPPLVERKCMADAHVMMTSATPSHAPLPPPRRLPPHTTSATPPPPQVTPLQLLVLGFIEIIIFSVNENLLIKLSVLDVGGSIIVHLFGAYFGLAASWVLSHKQSFDNPDNASGYHSDLFAMIGTTFLWVYWPSFVASPATGVDQARYRDVTATHRREGNAACIATLRRLALHYGTLRCR